MEAEIILVLGASGAGTTTLGQALERARGYKWLDTDNSPAGALQEAPRGMDGAAPLPDCALERRSPA